MDPAWESIQNVEHIAQETPLTLAKRSHKTVRKGFTGKLSAQVLTHSLPLRVTVT